MPIINYNKRHQQNKIKYYSTKDASVLSNTLNINGNLNDYQYYNDVLFSFKFLNAYDYTSNNFSEKIDCYKFKQGYLKINDDIIINNSFTIVMIVYFYSIKKQQIILTNNNNFEISLNRIGYNNCIVLKFGNNIHFQKDVLFQNKWNIIVYRCNGDTIQSFINGNIKKQIIESFNISNNNFYFGGIQNYNLRSFYGLIKNFDLYSTYKDDKFVAQKFLINSKFINDLIGFMPTNKLIFYLPLKQNKNISETGQDLSVIGSNIKYITDNDIPCAYCSNRGDYIASYSMFDSQNKQKQFSVSGFANIDYSTRQQYLFSFGKSVSDNNRKRIALYLNYDRYICYNIGGDNVITTEYISGWHHYCLTYNGVSTVKLYIDGKLIGERTDVSVDLIGNCDISIFVRANDFYQYYGTANGYVSAFRVYNKVLNENEIKLLSMEFY